MQRPLPDSDLAIAELETRQDEVLAQLEALELRIEQTLLQFGAVVKKGPGRTPTIAIVEHNGAALSQAADQSDQPAERRAA
jgi:hypothetical protein